MRGGAVALGIEGGWMGHRGIDDRWIALAQVSDLFVAGALRLTPTEMLAAVCEVMAIHLSLRNAVLWKRLAGQSRTLRWTNRHFASRRSTRAREHAEGSAAELLACGSPFAGETAIASLCDDRLGLRATLYVESLRRLDDRDHELLKELLRQMVGLPGAEAGAASIRPEGDA